MYSNIVKEKKKRTKKIRKIVPDSMISSILGERDQKKPNEIAKIIVVNFQERGKNSPVILVSAVYAYARAHDCYVLSKTVRC